MTTQTKLVHRADGWRLTGWHVLFILIGFFGVVFVVNGIFVKMALGTYSGIVSNEPYATGLHYNDRIAAGERQSALGWVDKASAGLDGAVAVEMTTASGEPVRGLELTGSIGRPATEKLDRPLKLVEAAPGHYVVNVGALDQGDWVVALDAHYSDKASDPVYRLRRRLWLKR